MSSHGPDFPCPTRHQHVGRRADGGAAVDHVVGEDAQAAFDIAHHFLRFCHVGRALRATLVDEGQVGAAVAEMLRHALGHLDATSVGGDDHRCVGVLTQVVLEHRHGRQVVDRAFEEALDLAAVQIDADHSLGTSRLEQVGHHAGGDRLAAFRLAILAGVPVERADGGDALGGGAVGGVDHDQLFHDRVVDAASVVPAVRLHDEHIAAADALAEASAHLAVGELDEARIAQTDAEVVGYLLRQVRVRAPRVERHSLGSDLLHGSPLCGH